MHAGMSPEEGLRWDTLNFPEYLSPDSHWSLVSLWLPQCENMNSQAKNSPLPAILAPCAILTLLDLYKPPEVISNKSLGIF